MEKDYSEKIYENTIPSYIREGLSKLAEDEANVQWKAARMALEAIGRFRYERDEEGKHATIPEYRVWNGLGHYFGGRSGDRMKAMATVASAFDETFVARYRRWEFGYFERALDLPEEHWHKVFDFLENYLFGNIVPIGRRLGVGEFSFIYRSQMMGHVVTNQMPADCSIDASEAPAVGRGNQAEMDLRMVVQQIFSWTLLAKRVQNIDNEKVARLVDLATELEEVAKEVVNSVFAPKEVDVE